MDKYLIQIERIVQQSAFAYGILAIVILFVVLAIMGSKERKNNRFRAMSQQDKDYFEVESMIKKAGVWPELLQASMRLGMYRRKYEQDISADHLEQLILKKEKQLEHVPNWGDFNFTEHLN